MTWETVNVLATDPTILASLEREAICAAILKTHQAHNKVTARTIRENLERPVNPHRIGAVIGKLVKQQALTPTREVDRSGNTKQRNSNRLMPVYRVTKPECIK
jgi:hypothetical protein